MNHCIQRTHLDSRIDGIMVQVREQLARRGRPLSSRALEGRVRAAVRDHIAREVLTPGSDLVGQLIRLTDYGFVHLDLPELPYFTKLSAHPDLRYGKAEFDLPRLLAAYHAAAAGSILADLQGRG